MTNAIVFDTETTGVDAPDVIELACTIPLADPSELHAPVIPIASMRWKPTKPIALGAMATHHIIPEDLEGCQLWPGTWTPPEGVTYLIGHKVDFDWGAIGSPHIARICTLALARSLLPELDSHSLSALVYYFMLKDVARERLKNAHSAEQDVGNCLFVLIELLKDLPGIASWHQLWVASEKARIPVRMSFGKYGPHEEWAKKNGGAMLCAEVRRRDAGYYSWLMNKCDQVKEDPYLAKALRGEAA